MDLGLIAGDRVIEIHEGPKNPELRFTNVRNP